MRGPGFLRSCGEGAGYSRWGMTLVELMLALALTGMLMSSIAVSLNLFWKYRGRSQDSAGLAALRRGLYEDLVVDLRGTLRRTIPVKRQVLQRPRLGESSFSEFSGGDERVLESQDLLTIPDQAIAAHPVNLVGEATWLAVFATRTSHRFPNTQEYGDEAAHIVWSNGQALRGVFGFRDDRAVTTSLAGAQDAPALIRRIVPWVSSAMAEDPSVTEIRISDRVRSVSFRYLDGDRWVSRWNSEELRLLPLAVECRVQWTEGFPAEVFIITIPAAEQ